MTARFRGPGRRRALVLALAAIAASSARGARGDDEAQADPHGPGPSEPSPRARVDAALPITPEEIVVVGRRPRAQAARDPTAAATVIEAGRFAGEAKGVAEIVATAPGVAVHEYGGLGQLATVSLRGSTSAGVLVLLDGLALNTAFGGGVDLSSIPRSWIDRIEVVRGAEGAHYGAGSLGGVVNIVTRRSPPGSWSAEASGGSFESAAASAEGAVERRGVALFLSGGAETTAGSFPYRWDPTPSDGDPTLVESRRANNGAQRAGAMAKLAAPVGEGRLDLLAQVSAGRRDLPGFVYGLTPENRQEDARALLSARLAAPGPRPGVLLAARLSTRLDALAVRLGTTASRQRGGAAGIEGEARIVHGPGALRLTLEAEGEALRGTGLGGTRARANLAATASEDLTVGRELRIAPALRAERVGRFQGISAKLGASLRVAGPLALRASAGQTFRAPSFAELHLQQGLVQPNPSLLPERGLGGDAGLVVDGGRLLATLAAHATLYRDLIYYQRVSLGQLRPFNAGKVLVRGVEAEIATAPVRPLLGLSLSAAYTLLRAEILRGAEGTLGNDVPHRARHRLFARAAIAPGPAEAHLEAHLVGRQYADDQNLSTIPSALVWNAGGSLRLARHPALRLSVEVRNALDDRTQQDGFGNPLPGRMVLVTLRADSTPSEGRP